MNRLLAIILSCALVFVLSVTVWSDNTEKDDCPVLQIIGRVKRPVSLTLNDLKRMETAKVDEFIEHGASFGSHPGYHGTYHIRGVSFRKLLEEVAGGVRVEPKRLGNVIFVFQGEDGYYASISFGEIYDSFLQGEGIIIGFEMNGEPLDVEKYGHLRLFIKTDKTAGRSVKRLNRIIVKYALDDPEFERLK